MSAVALPDLASDIHQAWSDVKGKQIETWEGYFKVGRLLRQARDQFTSDKEFGQWRIAQNFGFSQQWAHKLRQVADRETDVRLLLPTTAVVGSEVPGVNAVIKQLAPVRQTTPRGAAIAPRPATAPYTDPRITEFLTFLRTVEAPRHASRLKVVDERLHEFFDKNHIACNHKP